MGEVARRASLRSASSSSSRSCRRCTQAKSALRERASDARSSRPFTPFMRIASICCSRWPNRPSMSISTSACALSLRYRLISCLWRCSAAANSMEISPIDFSRYCLEMLSMRSIFSAARFSAWPASSSRRRVVWCMCAWILSDSAPKACSIWEWDTTPSPATFLSWFRLCSASSSCSLASCDETLWSCVLYCDSISSKSLRSFSTAWSIFCTTLSDTEEADLPYAASPPAVARQSCDTACDRLLMRVHTPGCSNSSSTTLSYILSALCSRACSLVPVSSFKLMLLKSSLTSSIMSSWELQATAAASCTLLSSSPCCRMSSFISCVILFSLPNISPCSVEVSENSFCTFSTASEVATVKASCARCSASCPPSTATSLDSTSARRSSPSWMRRACSVADAPNRSSCSFHPSPSRSDCTCA
mmetsp:Transcript_46162/g.88087  ORF Transcript_46162/g.88087 Transcript_46162/m.88087 type:complete len:418 (-) Transcript_46162:699-1952(-)